LKNIIRRKDMSQYDTLSTKLAGAMLIAGPALIVAAALVAAAGLATTTGRWYDNWLEGLLMLLGYSLQLIGWLALGRLIGATRPVLGLLITITSVLGTSGAILPSAVRIFSAGELALGVSRDQLDVVHGISGESSIANLLVFPFILCFFLNYILLAYGLWRTGSARRHTPALLVIGVVLFIIAQGASFEVNMPAYIAAVTLWLAAFAPLGISILRTADAQPVAPAVAGSAG
jgi:hypothetical protein